MRLTLLAILAVSCATAASAQAGEDRYGPARPQQMQLASTGTGYQGRMLTWSSRQFTPQSPEPSPVPPQLQTAPPAPQPAPTAPRQPAPVAMQRPLPLPQARPPVAATTPRAAVQQAPHPFAAATPARAPVPSRAALPDSLYAAPPPAAAPQRLAQAAPPATPATEGSQVRFYSVHRQYGLRPDAIPEPPPNASNYVLIGVPNDSGKSASSDKDEGGAGDKPF